MQTPRGTRITHHLRTMMQTKGFSLSDIYGAIDNPQIRYDSQRGKNQERRIRNGIVVIVDTVTDTAITAYQNIVETDQRTDQTDKDARRHFARRR